MVKEIGYLSKYQCEICNKEYTDEWKATHCENNHSSIETDKLRERKRQEYIKACEEYKNWIGCRF